MFSEVYEMCCEVYEMFSEVYEMCCEVYEML